MSAGTVLEPPPMYRVRPYFQIKKVRLPNCMYLMKPLHKLTAIRIGPDEVQMKHCWGCYRGNAGLIPPNPTRAKQQCILEVLSPFMYSLFKTESKLFSPEICVYKTWLATCICMWFVKPETGSIDV